MNNLEHTQTISNLFECGISSNNLYLVIICCFAYIVLNNYKNQDTSKKTDTTGDLTPNDTYRLADGTECPTLSFFEKHAQLEKHSKDLAVAVEEHGSYEFDEDGNIIQKITDLQFSEITSISSYDSMPELMVIPGCEDMPSSPILTFEERSKRRVLRNLMRMQIKEDLTLKNNELILSQTSWTDFIPNSSEINVILTEVFSQIFEWDPLFLIFVGGPCIFNGVDFVELAVALSFADFSEQIYYILDTLFYTTAGTLSDLNLRGSFADEVAFYEKVILKIMESRGSSSSPPPPPPSSLIIILFRLFILCGIVYYIDQLQQLIKWYYDYKTELREDQDEDVNENKDKNENFILSIEKKILYSLMPTFLKKNGRIKILLLKIFLLVIVFVSSYFDKYQFYYYITKLYAYTLSRIFVIYIIVKSYF